MKQIYGWTWFKVDNNGWKEAERRKTSGVKRRIEGQRVRPSSKASRKAASSSLASEDSQPPLGTIKHRN